MHILSPVGPAGPAGSQKESVGRYRSRRVRCHRFIRKMIWAMDFQFGTTVDGCTLKMLNVIDESTAQPLHSS